MSQKKHELNRAAGILLHPSALNTPFGIGDFGSQAFEFVKFLKESDQQFWQILPLGPTGYGDSPYQCLSSFAGNPLLIAPDGLISLNLVTKEEVMAEVAKQFQGQTDENSYYRWKIGAKIEYDKVHEFKMSILEKAYTKFINKKNSDFKDLYNEFQSFVKEEKNWLEDFVLYYALKKNFELKPWIEWPKEYANRVDNPLKVWTISHQKQLDFSRFVQWIFFKQWKELKVFANKNNVQIIGDMPIFVAHDSADTWAHRELFTIDENGKLIYQAGVPPDYFSKTGQLWGNPLYNLELLEKNDFNWFINRLAHQFKLFDWIRIDHFRGFQAYWQIDANETTAIKGKWIEAPGSKLFNMIKAKLGELPIIAEDLGIITKEVDELRMEFGFPGMRVLQFAFGDNANNPHLPHNYEANTVAYTGTHDNDTTLGWWQNHATEKEKKFLLKYINSDGMNIVLDLIRNLYSSVATLAIVPIQDILGEDSNSRMNVPSTTHGNWQYIVPKDSFTKQRIDFLKEMVEIYGRKIQK